MQDTAVKGFCYHLIFPKFFCLGGNSHMLIKSLFEKYSLCRIFKRSCKRGECKWLTSQQLWIPPCIIHSPFEWSPRNTESGTDTSRNTIVPSELGGHTQLICSPWKDLLHTSKTLRSVISYGHIQIFPAEPSKLLSTVQPFLQTLFFIPY